MASGSKRRLIYFHSSGKKHLMLSLHTHCICLWFTWAHCFYLAMGQGMYYLVHPFGHVGVLLGTKDFLLLSLQQIGVKGLPVILWTKTLISSLANLLHLCLLGYKTVKHKLTEYPWYEQKNRKHPYFLIVPHTYLCIFPFTAKFLLFSFF